MDKETVELVIEKTRTGALVWRYEFIWRTDFEVDGKKALASFIDEGDGGELTMFIVGKSWVVWRLTEEMRDDLIATIKEANESKPTDTDYINGALRTL